MFKSYLSGLSATNNTDYSLWMVTKMKRPRAYVPSICKEDESCAAVNKAKLICTHVIWNIYSGLTRHSVVNGIPKILKHFTSIEIAKEIDTNINPKIFYISYIRKL